MGNPINLEMIQRARAELSELVKLHPELREGDGKWKNNMQELEDMVGTPTTERMAKYRARQREKGFKAITVFLSPEAQAVLNKLQAEQPDASMGSIISNALLKPDSRERE